MPQKKLSFAQNASYNTIGVLIYDFCLWLTTLVVVRLSPDYVNAGVWQLSISITNVFAAIASFSLVSFYVSDVNDENKLEDYLCTQMLTCFFAFVICVLYALVCGYVGMQFLCIIIYMLVRILETVAGFIFGIDQRNYRMDHVGVSFTLRGVLDLAVFTTGLYLTKSLLVAASSMIFVTFFILIFYDIPHAKRFEKLKVSFSAVQIKKIITRCLPSVLSISLFIAVSTVPRQFLERLFDEATVGYYSTIAAPIVVIQVVVISMFTPLLRDVALLYKEKNFSKLKSIALRIALTLICFAVAGSIGAKLLGTFLYGLLYGHEIEQYCYLIYAVIGCVVMYAACWACWNMLIAMRKTKVMAVFSTIALVTVIFAGKPMIIRFGMNGVSFAILSAYTVYMLLSLIYIMNQIFVSKRET